jgi:protein SCO1/2
MWPGVLSIALAAACSRAPVNEYQLTGQILRVDQARQELTIKHQDIPHFMPGMTMAFRVEDPQLLRGRQAGELVHATLVVRGTDARLRRIDRTGLAAVTGPVASTHVMELLEPGQPVRDVDLVDQTTARRRLADWRGQLVAVTFMYTRCPLPNLCPLLDRQFQAVQAHLRATPGLAERVRLLSVTLDPEHDGPDLLAAHARSVQADPSIWRFAGGTAADVETLASQFGVSVTREGAEIVHNLRTALIDADGRLIKVVSGSDWTPADLIAEMTDARAGR